MHLLQTLVPALLAGAALAFPMDLFARDDDEDSGSTEVDWSQFDAPVLPLEPVADNTTLVKRAQKFGLKDKITMNWKNGEPLPLTPPPPCSPAIL